MTYLQLGLLDAFVNITTATTLICFIASVFFFKEYDEKNYYKDKAYEDSSIRLNKCLRRAQLLLCISVIIGIISILSNSIHESLILEKAQKESNDSALIFHKKIGK